MLCVPPITEGTDVPTDNKRNRGRPSYRLPTVPRTRGVSRPESGLGRKMIRLSLRCLLLLETIVQIPARGRPAATKSLQSAPGAEAFPWSRLSRTSANGCEKMGTARRPKLLEFLRRRLPRGARPFFHGRTNGLSLGESIAPEAQRRERKRRQRKRHVSDFQPRPARRARETPRPCNFDNAAGPAARAACGKTFFSTGGRVRADIEGGHAVELTSAKECEIVCCEPTEVSLSCLCFLSCP